jgi:hypothetical protein
MINPALTLRYFERSLRGHSLLHRMLHETRHNRFRLIEQINPIYQPFDGISRDSRI